VYPDGDEDREVLTLKFTNDEIHSVGIEPQPGDTDGAFGLTEVPVA
jgi:hypothetical protein